MLVLSFKGYLAVFAVTLRQTTKLQHPALSYLFIFHDRLNKDPPSIAYRRAVQ